MTFDVLTLGLESIQECVDSFRSSAEWQTTPNPDDVDVLDAVPPASSGIRRRIVRCADVDTFGFVDGPADDPVDDSVDREVERLPRLLHLDSFS